MVDRPKITIYTDGACSGNPGPGGWAAILISKEGEKEISGGAKPTTNNRMELTAAIEGLNALKAPSSVILYTDSRYVMDGLTKWLPRWRGNGWKTANKKPVKNEDLWRLLDEVAARHDIDWQWVAGHSGDLGNERADTLARESIP
jgi:ribonuclease HI